VLVKLVLVGRTMLLGPVDVVYEPEVVAVGAGGLVEATEVVVVVCIAGKVRLKCQQCQSF
jgi:hypothetical protein